MKIVVGGALNKKENAELIEKYGNGGSGYYAGHTSGFGVKKWTGGLLFWFLPDRGRRGVGDGDCHERNG